jgi:MoaA/NifB/PqqE/SkfB family radical SAM enzyme
MWNSLSHIHHLIKTIEISIDASTQKTYEIIRRGGDWGVLIENLNFISKCETIKKVRTSFVVQDTNYTEMDSFYKLMKNILKEKVEIYFNKITNWGTYTDGEFLIKQIWSESHPEFKEFLNQINKVCFNQMCIHNMNDIIKKHKLRKNLSKLL